MTKPPVYEVETVACNLCGKDDAKVLFRSMNGWPVDGLGQFAATTDKYGAYGTICRCRGCGLVYTNPRLKPGDLLEGYGETTDDDYLLEGDARSMNAYLSLAELRRHAKSGRLLDVGCFTGFFLNAARLTYDVTGVEPCRWARRYTEETLKIPVKGRTLEEAAFPDGHFDVVSLIDVIEHVADPTAVLREVARITKADGLLYLVTPDIESLSARLLRGKWWGLRPAHIYYFSEDTLRGLLEKAGYEIVSSRSYGRIFTWGYWLSRLSNYPRPIYGVVEALIRLVGLQNKFLYLDTRDSIQVVARKRR